MAVVAADLALLCRHAQLRAWLGACAAFSWTPPMGAGSRATAQPATRVSWTLAMTWMGVFWGGASSGPHAGYGGDEKSWAKRIFLTYVSRVGHVEIRNLFMAACRGEIHKC